MGIDQGPLVMLGKVSAGAFIPWRDIRMDGSDFMAVDTGRIRGGAEQKSGSKQYKQPNSFDVGPHFLTADKTSH